MTNAEKFKTAIERRDAYQRYVNGHGSIVEEFFWLEMNAEEEFKPCPFCGSKSVRAYKTVGVDVWYVSCDYCGVRMKGSTSKNMAIAEWNGRVK